MQITFKLYATLATYLPEEAKNHQINIDISDSDTANDILTRFNVPLEKAHLVLRNGVYVQPQQRNETNFLQNGDTLAVWPPVAGG